MRATVTTDPCPHNKIIKRFYSNTEQKGANKEQRQLRLIRTFILDYASPRGATECPLLKLKGQNCNGTCKIKL